MKKVAQRYQVDVGKSMELEYFEHNSPTTCSKLSYALADISKGASTNFSSKFEMSKIISP